MASSLGFGSQAHSIIKKRAFNTCFRCAFGVEPLRLSYVPGVVGSFYKKHAVTEHITSYVLRLRLFVGVMVSGSISPGSPPYFSPFPHGTCLLSVRSTYLALAIFHSKSENDSSACFPQGYLFSRYSRKTSRSVKPFSLTGLLPSLVTLSRDIQLTKFYLNVLPQQTFQCTRNAPDDIFLQPPSLCKTQGDFELFPFRSPLLREYSLRLSIKMRSNLFSFPPLTEMFHFSGFAPSS